MKYAPWSNLFSMDSSATLVPSRVSAPSSFQPSRQASASPVDAIQLLLRRIYYAAASPRQYKVVSTAKRSLDVAVSALALLALSPVFLAVALAVKLTDGGPAFFWQERVGLYGEIFQFPKFRSMITNAEALKRDLLEHNQHGTGVTFKMQDDPRITRVGRFIRRFSLDELPQLWCVLKGDMSLVGPRPAVPSEVERYADHHRNRLHTLPGLTCTWQVSGRSEIPFEQQVKLDEEYVQNRSFWMDLSLLARTVPAVLNGRGAY